MSYNNVLSDSLTRIRNAQMARLLSTKLTYSKMMLSIVEILKHEGFISDFHVLNIKKGIKNIEVIIKYYDYKPVIKKIEVFSKPGRRVYVKGSNNMKYFDGLGMLILSTSQGIMTDMDANNKGIGGELLFGVY